MSESGYYPPGAEHDPRAPWNQVNLLEKYEDLAEEILFRKVDDLGYLRESLGEMDDEITEKIAARYKHLCHHPDKAVLEQIGQLIVDQIDEYMEVTEDELQEELEARNG